MKHYLKYSILLLLTAFCTGCVNEDNFSNGDGSITGREAVLKVSLDMPVASTAKTYAISEADENYVETIDVLAFKKDESTPSGWAYAYSAKGRSIIDKTGDNPAKSKKQFTVTLIKNTNQQTFVFLANVRNEVEALGQIGIGADKDELLARLEFENVGSWNANNNKPEDAPDKSFTPFPLWGQTDATITDATTELTGIKLLRGIARVDVALANEVTNFTLDQVYIYNSKTKGQIVPDGSNLTSISKVKAATVPQGDINNDTPLMYVIPTGMERLFERTIYLFEAKGTTSDKSSEATCVIVGGTYGTDTKTTYYRLDFFKRDGSGKYTKDYRDILRNHLYRINIISVSGGGFNTPDDAFNAKAVNMEAKITEWDDGGMGNVVFDGQYALSVDPTGFNFPKDALNAPEDMNAFSIFTDFPEGWTIPAESIVDATTGTPITWIKVMKGVTPGTETASGIADTKADLWLNVDENTTGTVRSAKILVTAGRLSYPVIVNQSITLRKFAFFSFIEYINSSNEGYDVPYGGAQITAKVKTNMGWKLKTSINGVEATMAEPTEPVAKECSLSINIPPVADEWTSAKTKVWIEYAGLKLQEVTYSQIGYTIDITGVPTTINKYGQDVKLELAGYFPDMKFRVVNAADDSEVSNVVNCTAIGSKTMYGSTNVTLSIYPNSSSSSRNVKFQYEKFSGVWVDIATVSQDRSGLTLPTSGTIAPPGVIGVGAKTGRLTLDGSKEYTGNPAGETVYCVFFKWGSMVAISGATGAYTSSMVAWVPPGFTGDISDWASIPYGTETAFPSQNNAIGLGDPCKLASRSGTVGNYRMPMNNGVAQEQWENGGWETDYKGVSGRWSDFGGTRSQFYPAAGYRLSSDGLLNFVGINGNYWSSTAFNATASRALNFSQGSVTPNNAFDRTYCFLVRCVQN